MTTSLLQLADGDEAISSPAASVSLPQVEKSTLFFQKNDISDLPKTGV